MTSSPSIERLFEAAVRLVSLSTSSVASTSSSSSSSASASASASILLQQRATTAQKLQLYALYKQATIGPCSVQQGPRPPFYQMAERAKWDAWHALGDHLNRQQAMVEYVRALTQLVGDDAWSKYIVDVDVDVSVTNVTNDRPPTPSASATAAAATAEESIFLTEQEYQDHRKFRQQQQQQQQHNNQHNQQQQTSMGAASGVVSRQRRDDDEDEDDNDEDGGGQQTTR